MEINGTRFYDTEEHAMREFFYHAARFGMQSGDIYTTSVCEGDFQLYAIQQFKSQPNDITTGTGCNIKWRKLKPQAGMFQDHEAGTVRRRKPLQSESDWLATDSESDWLATS